MQTTTTPAEFAESILGLTVRPISGTRYRGAFGPIASATVDAAGWVHAFTASGAEEVLGVEDTFGTEAEARAAAKARRVPRKARTTQPLYGDFAQFAQLYGFKTDGSGRKA